ncbi:MAG: hypothetical protein ABI723_14770 [Bacteroidia bacterium]
MRLFYLALFTLWLVITGCNSNKPAGENQTIIKGTINYPKSNKVYLFGYASTVDKYLLNKTAIDSAQLDNKGDYFFSLKRNKPDLFDLRNGTTDLASNLYLSPHDNLIINFPAPDQKPIVIENSDAAKYNQFIIDFIDSFYINPKIKHFYYIATNYLDADEYITYCNDRQNKQLSFYRNYFGSDDINPDFNKLMINDINYQSAVDRLMYAWKKRMKGENSKIDSSYYNFITPSLIENKEALESPAYMRFLYLYIKDKYERMVEKGELPRSKTEKLIPAVEVYKLATANLNHPYRDVVLYNLVLSDWKTINKKEYPGYSITPLDTLISWLRIQYPDKGI